MKTRQWFLIIFILYIAGFLSHSLYLGRTVYGDGRFYYAWTKSVAIDFKLPRNNKYTIGPALVWAPAVRAAHTILGGSGNEFPYQFIVGLTSVLGAVSGLVLLFRFLTQYFPRTVSLLTTLAIAFATNLFFYGSLDSVNSHALSFFATTVFLNLLYWQKNWFVIGLSLGVVALMRTQDVIFALTLIPHRKQIQIPELLLGFLLAFSPQLLAWQLTSGKFWMSPYLTGSEGFNLLHPHILEVLFSYHNGLFFWTPILAMGLIGLLLSKFNIFLKVLPLAQIFLVSTWSTWWQGASYSGRMFVSVLPIFALGIGHVFQWLWTKWFRELHYFFIFIIPLSLLNMLLIIYFLLIT